MSLKIPRLLLFDIDGTLVVSRHKKVGNDFGSYLLECLSIAFGQDIKRNGVEFAGGTDPGITKAILTTYNITEKTCPNYAIKLDKAFKMLPEIAEKGVKEGRYNWKILPNVNELLNVLSQRQDLKLGLLTGNVKSVAFLKLRTAGVDVSFFEVDTPEKVLGAFGSDCGDRAKLVEIAKQRYCEFLGISEINPNDVLVIGDTPKDVECAHVNLSPCVAVTTGVYNEKQLSDADFVLSGGFEDIDKSVLAMVDTCR